MKLTVRSPPARQVQLGGATFPLHWMLPPTSAHLPPSLLVTAVTVRSGGGTQVNCVDVADAARVLHVELVMPGVNQFTIVTASAAPFPSVLGSAAAAVVEADAAWTPTESRNSGKQQPTGSPERAKEIAARRARRAEYRRTSGSPQGSFRAA